MIKILKEEGTTDEQKKESCLLDIQKTEAHKKELETALQDLSSSLEQAADEISTIKAEIDATKADIAALDKSVAEATEQRKEEHAAFVASSASNNAAIDLLKMAVNRLNKFYNPSMYNAPKEEPELVQATDSQDGIFFAQVSARQRDGKSAGVLALLADISKDVELKMGEEKHDEEESQTDYETSMNEAAAKRAADSKVIVDAEVTKSESVAALEDLKAQQSEKGTLLKSVGERLGDLHKFCDMLIETFEERKKARESEIESDASAQMVLKSTSGKAER